MKCWEFLTLVPVFVNELLLQHCHAGNLPVFLCFILRIFGTCAILRIFDSCASFRQWWAMRWIFGHAAFISLRHLGHGVRQVAQERTPPRLERDIRLKSVVYWKYSLEKVSCIENFRLKKCSIMWLFAGKNVVNRKYSFEKVLYDAIIRLKKCYKTKIFVWKNAETVRDNSVNDCF